MRCDYARDDGPYVLGALSPAERADYERHLASCQPCRNAVSKLAALPGLLARLDVTTAERVALEADAAEASRLPRLLKAAEAASKRDRQRRRWRTTGALLAAACITALVSIGFTVLLRPAAADPGTPPVAMTPMVATAMGAEGPVTAEIGIADAPVGTQIWMRCWYASTEHRKPYTFRLVAVGTDGQVEQVASWKAGADDDISVSGVTHFASAELDRVELQHSDGAAMLVYHVE